VSNAAATTEKVRYEEVTGNIGALVHGVDPADGYAETLREDLVTALHVHGVLFFHASKPVDLDTYQAFVGTFGEIRIPDRPERVGGSIGSNALVTAIDSVTAPADVYRANCWHTDAAWEACPPQAAALTPEVLPQVGGDTMWASMYAAWDALSSRYQRLLDGLEALQSTAALLRHYTTGMDRSRVGPSTVGEPVEQIHPVVLRDPITKRQMLYVNSNWTERIIGLKPTESDQLIEMLCAHVNTPEFHVRLKWAPNIVAVWEQRVTQHRSVADYTGHRKLRRMTIAGDRPAA
jgi:taurine dioxygenase